MEQRIIVNDLDFTVPEDGKQPVTFDAVTQEPLGRSGGHLLQSLHSTLLEKSRSTGTRKRKQAEKFAAKWEAELPEGRYKSPSKITWGEFR